MGWLAIGLVPVVCARQAGHTNVMDAWIGVIGALAGAAIALVSQYITNHSARRERDASILLDQCAQLIALTEDFRNRIWRSAI